MKRKIYLNLKKSFPFLIMVSIYLSGLVAVSDTRAQANRWPKPNLSWTKLNNMPYGRQGATSCVVDGNIYVIGGSKTRNYLTEFDPVTETWTSKANMPNSRMSLASCVVSEKIYAIGGFTEAHVPALSVVDQYDPSTDTWIDKSPMLTERLGLGVSVVEGKIYAIGGMTSGSNFWSGMQSTVEVYDPATDVWSSKTDLPTPRVWLTTSAVDGKIYAIGGALQSTRALTTVEEYDPSTDTWTTKAPMPTARMTHAAAVVDGIIYVIGGGTVSGFPEGGYSVVEAYDPATDTWVQKTYLPEPRAFLCASAIDGKIYVMGGILSAQDVGVQGLKSVYVYDPMKDPVNPILTSTDQIVASGSLLHQNVPNPFNQITTISCSLEIPDYIILKVYNSAGQVINTLVNENQAAGTYSVKFDAGNYPAGLYYYQLQTGTSVETRKMLLVR